MNNNTIKIAAILFLAGFTLSACHEKGCTNRNALNYNVTADQDDGSCIICNATINNLGSKSVYLVDNNFSSPFFNQQVARFDLTQPETTYSYTQCGAGNCTVNLSITSLVNEQMFISEYELERWSGPVEVEWDGENVTIPANGSSSVGVITTLTNPPFESIGLDSVIVDVFGDISYN